MSVTFASEQLESRNTAGGLGFARLGEALYREKRTDDALRILSAGTRRHPEYTPGLLVLGRLYFETGGLLEAKTELEKILRVDSRCPAALKLLAQIAAGLHAHGESARLYAQLSTLEPWDAEFVEHHRRAVEMSGGGTLSTATQEAAGFVELNLNDVGNFLPQGDDTASGFEAGSATVSVTKSQMFEPKPEPTSIYAPPEENAAAHADTALVDKDRVEGVDIEKRLDDLFSPDAANQDGLGSETATVESVVLGDSGKTAGDPMVTGEDIENQLDKLFSGADATLHQAWDAAPAPAKPAVPSPSEATLFPGLDERTIAMPAFSPSALADAFSKAEPPAPPAMPAEEVVDAVDVGSATETGAFEAGEVQGASDTVIGDDIGMRLDELFGPDDGPTHSSAPAAETDDDDPGTSETLAYLAPSSATTFTEKDAGSTVSGDDIESRLSEMFDAEPAPKEAEPKTPMPASFTEEGSQTLGLSRAAVFGEEAHAEQQLDEDSFPEAPPNVATVTLAEIYFDQGLKEQALQIYRQLLEREPDNAAVKKRIEEIEASKAAEARGNGPSGEGGSLSPRPGLKVPRRKK